MTSYIIAISSIIVASFSQILLKLGASKKYDSFIRQYLNPYVIIGYGMMFISLFLTQVAYRGLEYRIVPLLESLGIVFVTLLSRGFFKEKITPKKIGGIALIILGIAVYYI